MGGASNSYHDNLSTPDSNRRLYEVFGGDFPTIATEHAFPDMELDKSHFQYIVEHIFLPPQLPQTYDLEGELKDESLYWFIAWGAQRFIDTFTRSTILPSIAQRFFNVFLGSTNPLSISDMENWNKLLKALNLVARIHRRHRLMKEDIETALQGMDVGDILPLHIAGQNAGVIFRKIDSQNMTFEAFELSLPTEVITGNTGKIIQRFPTNPPLSFAVNSSIISGLSNLLSYLSENTPEDAIPSTQKGGSSHHEIRQTVSPRYITEALAGIIRAYSPGHLPYSRPRYIHKRISDHVLWKSALKPWRRTPALLLVKVALQTTAEEMGIDKAYGYKSFWAFSLSLILEKALKEDAQTFTMDFLHAMNVKLARRLAKLGVYLERGTIMPLKKASDTVIHASDILERRWKKVQYHSAGVVQWQPLEVVSKNDFTVTFPNSQDYLLNLVHRQKILDEGIQKYDSMATVIQLISGCTPRIVSPCAIPTSLSTKEIHVSLYDFENWVADHLPNWSGSPSRSETDCFSLFSIIEDYRSKAIAHYKDDPERLSLMYLCLSELWVALDEITVKWCPLLSQYSPEIPESFLDPLLLPTLAQMKRLHKVQLHLQERHNTAQTHGGLSIFSDINSHNSFANRFFASERAGPIVDLEVQIREWAEQQKAAKLVELERKNEEYISLTREALSMVCEERLYWDKKTSRREFGHAFWLCKRCNKERQARKLRIKVFEEPLPSNPLHLRPIVFELACPPPIAIWRDATFEILSVTSQTKRRAESEFYSLKNYYPLNQFYKSPYPSLLSTLGLASTTKSISMSHYAERSLPVKESAVIVKHAGRFCLFDEGSKSWVKQSPECNLRSSCTFSVDGAYSSLHPYVGSTTHSTNEVLSSIHACPSELPVGEYVAFGQLRSGIRLQWWNIMRAIRAQSLTFSEASVVHLILQSIWQAESMGDAGVCREAHASLQDHNFGVDVGEELYLAVQSLGNNWKQYLYLSIIAALAIRLLEVSPHADVQEKAQIIIRSARSVAQQWITTLIYQGEEDSIDCDQPSPNDEQSRKNVLAIALVFRSTFDTTTNPFSSQEDVKWYIYAGMLSTGETDQHSTSIRRLVSRDRRISLRLRPILYEICQKDHSVLHNSVKMSWKGYVPGTPWRPLPAPANHWWMTETKKGQNFSTRVVHLSITEGILLIDGKAADRLPSEYTGHPSYKELLGDQAFLDVRPSTMKGMIYQTYFRRWELHFGRVKGEVIIRRRRYVKNDEEEVEEVEEYIPSKAVSDDLPDALTFRHRYWFIVKDSHFEICPEQTVWEVRNSAYWTAQLVFSAGKVTASIIRTTASGKAVLLDPHSRLYRSLSQALYPLEPAARGLLVTRAVDDKLGVTSVYIPRHDLSFRLKETGQLESRSLPGYVVSKDRHGVGCLFGLDTFLILRAADHCENVIKILVPKGSFGLSVGLYGHPIVKIDIGDHRGYFVYDIDQLIGRLVGNRTIESDLYLVKLHAFTSSPFFDPLTRRSGTDEALDRLQSASSSCTLEISPEARTYLDEIASLSPIRTPYPPHLEEFKMETVEWNRSLPVTSQHWLFRKVVQGILSHWGETDIFHQRGDLVRNLEIPRGMDHLNLRQAVHSSVFSDVVSQHSDTPNVVYQNRDSLMSPESQAREHAAFQIAMITRQAFPPLPVCRDLLSLITSWSHLHGIEDWKWGDLHQWLKVPSVLPISDMWCTIFELCRKTHWPPPFEATISLSLLGFYGIPQDILATLLAVIHDPILRTQPFACPRFGEINLKEGKILKVQIIRELLKECALDITLSNEYRLIKQRGETAEERTRRIVALYNKTLDEQLEAGIQDLQRYWDATEEYNSPPPDVRGLIRPRRLLDLSSPLPLSTIQNYFSRWWYNRAFIRHISKVSSRMSMLCSPLSIRPPYSPEHPKPTLKSSKPSNLKMRNLNHLLWTRDPPSSAITSPPLVPTHSTTVACPVDELELLLKRLWALSGEGFEKRYLYHLRNSIAALKLPRELPQTIVSEDSKVARDISHKLAIELFESIQKALSPKSIASELLRKAGLWPAITPYILLRFISLRCRSMLPPPWLNILIHYAVALHDAKRHDRAFHQMNLRDIAQASLELHHRRTWDPLYYPDWLLFEIDNDISIRDLQAELALEMLDPKLGKNSVMQLNMGEGKSSVIVPIVAASLGAKEDVLPRVVVPRAQTKQQFQFLRRALTSLCNRSVIYLPFNRQLKLTREKVREIHEFLQRFARAGGIWLCEPEQLLSLKLLGLDKTLNSPSDSKNGGPELVRLQLWLNDHTQDILDESDEVLTTRQQVIYTIGHQRNIDGSPRRWEIIEKLLSLLVSYGEESDQFAIHVEQHEPPVFPRLRIRQQEYANAHDHMRRFIQKTFSNGEWPLPQSIHSAAVDFITAENPSQDSLLTIKEHSAEDQQVEHVLLVLRGMVHHDILLHGLMDKRWRVEYGLDLKRSWLAIPFRAKDFPTLRSEFGHPDVTILLTCLSYYYNGLDDTMMRRVLKRLLRSATPDITYAEWITSCGDRVPPELKTIKGINMDDKQSLRNIVFPLLRYHKVVIDFYLNSFVFPRQAKEFPSKLLSSGWDLAEEKRHITTGFSGTNDGRFLLPATVKQIDREQQLHINAKVLSHLLLKENQTVISYPSEYKSTELLDRIYGLGGRHSVILDVGAQILDCSNLEFARSWLSRYNEDSDIGAAIFFDEGGNLSVLTRDHSIVPFLESPYSNTLERCLVYLDDAHTRGTDLRLPPGTKAIVTLGPRLTKDKLVQGIFSSHTLDQCLKLSPGCMRMRQLGSHHTLTFMASEEVVGLITMSTGCASTEITSADVVIWTIRETWRQVQADVPAWVQQGISFMKREEAWKTISRASITKSEVERLFCAKEGRSLEELYGVRINAVPSLYHIVDATKVLGERILNRCSEFGPIRNYNTLISEEMEVELVHEKETEKEVQQIPIAKPAPHSLHEHVTRFIMTGKVPPNTPAILPVSRALSHTSLNLPKGISQALSHLRVTQDFCSTILLGSDPYPGVMDHFLRPVEWVLSTTSLSKGLIVALSPYEVNSLLPLIRQSSHVRLHLFAPRGTRSMRSFEALDRFVLAARYPVNPLPRPIALQLNLFSGSLYILDHAAYVELCGMLRLYFDELPPHLAKPNVIATSRFVKDPAARLVLGMIGLGFKGNPVTMLRKLLVMRRYGQSLGPSHMGKMLHGTKLHKGKGRDFEEAD